MNKNAVAARLGMKASEITDVYDADEGTVIVTSDGVRLVDVPEEAPDGAGKTGLMFLAAPKDGNVYSFPTYAPHAELDDETSSDEDAIPATVTEILDWVGDDHDRAQRALDAENADDKPRKTLVEALEELLTASAK